MPPTANISEAQAKQRLVVGVLSFAAAAGAVIASFLLTEWRWWMLGAAGGLIASGAFCIYEWKHRW